MNAIAIMQPNATPNMKAGTGLQKPGATQSGFQQLISSVLSSSATVKTDASSDEGKLLETLQRFLKEFNEQNEDDLSLEQLVKKLADLDDKQHLLDQEALPQLTQMFPFQGTQQIADSPLSYFGSITKTASMTMKDQASFSGSGLLQEFIRFLKQDAASQGVQVTSTDLKSLLKKFEAFLHQTETALHAQSKDTGAPVKRTVPHQQNNMALQPSMKMQNESTPDGKGTGRVNIFVPKPDQTVTPNGSFSTTGNVMSKVEQFVLHVPQQQSSTASFVQELSTIMNRGRLMTLPNGQTQLSIKLHPEHLGSLDIQILQRNGEMTARILASTTTAKDLIDSNLHHLRHALAGQNITVDKIDVSHHTPEWMNGKHGRGHEQATSQQQEQNQQQQPHQEEHVEDSFEKWLNEMEVEEV